MILITAGSAQGLRAQDIIDKAPSSVLDNESFPSRVDTLAVQGSGPFLIRPYLIGGSLNVRIDAVLIRPTEYRVDLLNGL